MGLCAGLGGVAQTSYVDSDHEGFQAHITLIHYVGRRQIVRSWARQTQYIRRLVSSGKLNVVIVRRDGGLTLEHCDLLGTALMLR